MPKVKTQSESAPSTIARRPKRVGATHSRKVSVETISPETQSVAQEEIARLAYSYWVGRGYESGNPEEDWLRAERELLSR